MSRSKRQQAVAVTGVAYVLLSLASSVWYLTILAPSFTNDLWWAGYNVSGHQAFLVDLVNQLLVTHTTGTFDPLAPSAVVAKSYSAIVSTTLVWPTDVRAYTLGRLTSLEYAVVNLRRLSASWSFRMNSQPCWVDFNATFEVAHTLARQQRCRDRYQANAAVYIEAILRNQNMAAFLTHWGAADHLYDTTYQRGLRETQRGRDFLASLPTERPTTSVEQELAYWRSFNVTHFTLQWQNRWQPGIAETIVLENAFGMQQQVTLKAQDQVTGPWSSQSLYWLPIQDVFSGQVMNRSFIRGTSRYFGANATTLGLAAINIEAYRGIADAKGALSGVANVFHSTVGPYLSVDMFLVPVPPLIVTVYNQFQQALLDQITASPDLTTAYLALGQTSVAPVPPVWRNLTYYGGDPMCTSGVATGFVQQSFDFFETCSSQVPLTTTLSGPSVLFSLLAYQSAAHVNQTSVAAVCALATATQSCLSVLAAGASLLNALSFPSDLVERIGDIPAAVRALDVGLMQYVAPVGTTAVTLVHTPLLTATSTEPWNFFGWCMLMDWAKNIREVVSIEGDLESMALISNAYDGQPFITSNNVLEAATVSLLYLVQLTTVLLFAVGTIVVAYAGHVRGQFLGFNLFRFNRLTGAVWIGRPLAFIRGASALLLLSAPQLALKASPLGTALALNPRLLVETMIVAGEATWLTYVCNELLVVFAPEATTLYSPWSSGLVWVIYVGMDLAAPVGISVALDRQCVGKDMDYGLLCSSGVVYVGSYERLVTLAVVQAAVVIGAFVAGVVAAWYRRQKVVVATVEPSLHFTSTTAAFALPLANEASGQTYDVVTCFLCGLVPVWYRAEAYTFNLKLWDIRRYTPRTPSWK
ncbi:hypothetical protein ACHHYP_06085 [Achlya hypogyna]|uniref:Transmembrane protein n=1 Tax=Achlya hypogyna TaxID=1202772 RepID=A0A1V9YV89_ACHHY|nr:hypothetical protein ACHHYP_06085 [Achlya hypogyna]